MPPVSGKERDGVDPHEPIDELGDLLREPEPDPAPVVDHERKPLEPQLDHERAEELRIAADRVVERRRLVGATEARQVGRDASGALQEWQPEGAAVRDAVQVEHGRLRPGLGLAPYDARAADVRAMLHHVAHAGCVPAQP